MAGQIFQLNLNKALERFLKLLEDQLPTTQVDQVPTMIVGNTRKKSEPCRILPIADEKWSFFGGVLPGYVLCPCAHHTYYQNFPSLLEVRFLAEEVFLGLKDQKPL